MRVAVEFDWEQISHVELSPAGRLVIPPVPAEPGIYRFRISGHSRTEVYIGESVDLRRRMRGNYASTHTGTTNIRVRELLLSHLAERRVVHLVVMRAASLDIDGQRLPADLSDKSTRLLAENAAVAIARVGGETIHNL